MSTNERQEEKEQAMKEKLVFFAIFTVAVIFAMASLQSCAPTGVSLNGTSWTVTQINGQPVLENAPVTMVFEAENVGGKAACNSYFAAYALKGDQISFDGIGQTEMYCMEEGVMDLETLFLQSLSKADTVAINGSQMTITLKDGGSLALTQQ